jgi:hypothetical protein
MKHVSSEEKATILQAHGWERNDRGGWHRVGEDSDSGMGVSQAFNQLGGATELERTDLFEYEWQLLEDEEWTHPVLLSGMRLSGAMALEVQQKIGILLENSTQNMILDLAEEISKNGKIREIHLAKRRMKHG